MMTYLKLPLAIVASIFFWIIVALAELWFLNLVFVLKGELPGFIFAMATTSKAPVWFMKKVFGAN